MSLDSLMSAVECAPKAAEEKGWAKYKQAFKILTQEKGYKDVDAVRFIASHEKLTEEDQKKLLNVTKQWKRAKSWKTQ